MSRRALTKNVPLTHHGGTQDGQYRSPTTSLPSSWHQRDEAAKRWPRSRLLRQAIVDCYRSSTGSIAKDGDTRVSSVHRENRWNRQQSFMKMLQYDCSVDLLVQRFFQVDNSRIDPAHPSVSTPLVNPRSHRTFWLFQKGIWPQTDTLMAMPRS